MPRLKKILKQMIKEQNINTKEIVYRLIHDHIAKYKSKIIIAIIFMIITAICSAAIVWLVKPAIDDIFVVKDKKKLLYVPLIMLSIYSIKGVSEFFQNFIVKYVGQQILTDLQMQMYRHLLNCDYNLIKSQSSGKLISRFTNDIILMRSAVSNGLVGCAKHFMSIIFLIIVMFTLDVHLSLFIFLAFPAAIYPVQKLGRKMRLATSKAQEELSEFTAQLDETFNSIKIVKSFCTEEIEANRAEKITQNILMQYKKASKSDSLTSPIMEVLSGLGFACVLWYGGFAVIEGKMSQGALFAFITAFVSAYRPFKSLVSLNVNLQEGIAATNRIFNILDIKPQIIDSSDAKTINLSNLDIKLDDISFQYEDERKILNNFSTTIKANKTYALVGQSGSGKTTISNLLIRMIDPKSGQIIIGDTPIKNIKINSLRSQISIVTQETLLFDATVAENIAYGIKNPNNQKIIEAAKKAAAHEFIQSLPNGYKTALGTAGHSLSGGQRQRLSIARAFYKNSPILILDEATSALDPSSEQEVIKALQELQKNRTTIIITHRLNSIKDADKIIVMKNGEIIEQGSHKELMDNEKEYYILYNKQLKEKTISV